MKFKQQIIGQIGKSRTKDVELIIPLKYLSNFSRTTEISLSNCEFSLKLTWSKQYFLVAVTAANQKLTFTITDTKLYVPVVTLSTKDNARLFK